MDDNARRCALPGCAVWIEDIPGRPPRRYCTAAHRAAARQARRAAMQLDQHPRLAETLPWLREPDGEPEQAPDAGRPPSPRTADVAPEPAPPRSRRSLAVAYLRRRSRPVGPLSQRRRAVAVLGVAGILAGGYAVTASAPVERTTAAADQSAVTPLSEDEWAARAQVTLASLDRQLDVIAQTEEAWNSMPANERSGALPAPIKALKERKKLLESRKTALKLQLDSYQSLGATKDQLLEYEFNLRSVEKVLEDLPPESQRSPEQAVAVAVLTEERDFRLRQRNNKRAELDGMQRNVETATRAPLPDDGQATAEVSNQVMDIIEHDGGGTPPAETPVPPRPELVGGRDEHGGRERQDTANSAPPDPRGPRDESGERRNDPDARAAGGQGHKDEHGPIGKVVGAVGSVVTGSGHGDAAAPAPAAAASPAAHGGGNHGKERDGGGLIGRVGDVIDGGDSRPEQKAADTGERTAPAAPAQAAPVDSAPAQAASDGGLLGRVGDRVGGGNGGRDGDAQPVVSHEAPPAPVGPAAAGEPADNGATGSGGPSARPSPRYTPRTAPAPVASTPDVELARQVVGAMPGGMWVGPAMEVAIAEAERSAAEEAGRTAQAPGGRTVAPVEPRTADPGSGPQVRTLPLQPSGPASPSTGGAVAPGEARTADPGSGPQLRTLPLQPSGPAAPASSPGGGTVAPGEARTADPGSGPQLRTLPLQPSGPAAPASPPSGSANSSAGSDGAVRIPEQQTSNTGSATPGNASITRNGDTTTYRTSDESGTRTLTRSADGYTASYESPDGSSRKSVTTSSTRPSSGSPATGTSTSGTSTSRPPAPSSSAPSSSAPSSSAPSSSAPSSSGSGSSGPGTAGTGSSGSGSGPGSAAPADRDTTDTASTTTTSSGGTDSGSGSAQQSRPTVSTSAR